MKIIAIGDLHGKAFWKEIDPFEFDKIIFLGDYTDSKTADDDQIYSNLLDILEFRSHFSDKVILLLGNHDIQYLYYPKYRCSGFRPNAQHALTFLLNESKDYFQVAAQFRNYLFTHAGVSNRWMEYFTRHLIENNYPSGFNSIADLFNAVLELPLRDYLFTIGEKRGGLPGASGGIVWADKTETQPDPVTGYYQVVGHSPVRQIEKYEYENATIVYADVLRSVKSFYELTI